jgi:hypothetical protein
VRSRRSACHSEVYSDVHLAVVRVAFVGRHFFTAL